MTAAVTGSNCLGRTDRFAADSCRWVVVGLAAAADCFSWRRRILCPPPASTSRATCSARENFGFDFGFDFGSASCFAANSTAMNSTIAVGCWIADYWIAGSPIVRLAVCRRTEDSNRSGHPFPTSRPADPSTSPPSPISNLPFWPAARCVGRSDLAGRRCRRPSTTATGSANTRLALRRRPRWGAAESRL